MTEGKPNIFLVLKMISIVVLGAWSIQAIDPLDGNVMQDSKQLIKLILISVQRSFLCPVHAKT